MTAGANATSATPPVPRVAAIRRPLDAFEVTLWRTLAVFRLATLGYAMVLTTRNFASFASPVGGWVVTGVMVAWTVIAIYAYSRPNARVWPVLGPDLLVTAACLLSSRWVVGEPLLSHGSPTLTVTWMACPVLAVAVARGRASGAAAAIGMGACDLFVRGLFNQATFTGTVIMVTAAVAVGHLARLAEQVQQRLREVAELEAATRERERFARGIHDSVLQVLALVQRRGAEIGGDAAELGRLAGDQEVALRALVNPSTAIGPAGLVDLRATLSRYGSAGVTIASPAAEVWLTPAVAAELAAAVGSALDNVRGHAGPRAQAWILVEDEPAGVRVTVRDDGPGIPSGRLEQAAQDGRLGVAQSIRGRIRDLGGSVTFHSEPNQGTEVRLQVPRSLTQAPA